MTEGLARLSAYQPPANAGLDIVFEDEHLVVLNKPAGLLSVPGRGAELADCALLRMRRRYPQALLVHRLDEATSGLLLFALNPAVQKAASWAFESRRVKKKYTACVDGLIREDEGMIDAPIAKDWPRRPIHIVDLVHGKSAITAWRVTSRDQQVSQTLVQLEPQTGRTHQLRVHMQHIGHPIIGDRLYGLNAETEPRLMLHASGLQMPHPAKPDALLDLCKEADF
jgi:tRNA pseudouridine32 synthase / 23S rRNA pseudouridine746 synthase